MAPNHKLQKTLRTPSAGGKPRKLYILVMGLTGAGKSTFISVLTDNKDIPIGKASELDGVTQEVQDYILLYPHKGILYEIHLIDSPGFDDGTMVDAEVLSKVADYVNTNYKLKKRLAGVLYLHDITRGKVGAVGQRNIRMLENLIGADKFNNCAIVTTKWGCSNPSEEYAREGTLRNQEKYFGSILPNKKQDINHSGAMKRFEPKTKATALSIILPFLPRKFIPEIPRQMVDPNGPKLALGETETGKVVAENLAKLAKTEKELAKVREAKQLLAQKFDEATFEEFKQKSKKLRRHIRLQRSGRWVMRTTIVGGAIVATVLTLGPGASVFALEPIYEKAVRGQRRKEKMAKMRLEEDFKNRSKDGSYLRGKNAAWLWDNKVQHMKDLDDEAYSIRNESSESILAVARKGEKVGVVVDGSQGEGEGIEAALGGMLIGGEAAVGGIEEGAQTVEESDDSESESESEYSDLD